jgi:putative endopeptidase
MVDAVEGIKSLDDLTAYLVNTPGEDHLYDLWEQEVRQDPENPGKCLLSIEKSFFFLKDPAEYREMTAEGEYRKEAFAAYFRNMLVRLGYSEEEAKQKFDHCFAWESMMNAAGPGEEESSPEFTEDVEHLYTRDDLMAAAPNVPLLETLEKADGYPAMEKYYIPELTYIEKLNELYTEENVPLMRDYIILQGIFDMAGVLDWESYVMYDECLAAISYDISELDRETYPENQAYSEVDAHLAWPVAQLYVENYTNPGDKERITKLVDEIIRAYYGIIDEAEFLSDETRAGAYEKLDHMSINVLYPDNWAPYSFEDVDFASKEEGGTLWEAFRAVIKHEHKRDVEKLSEPYDRKFWDSLPFAVNCAYVPDVNGIYICAGFAQGDNYYPGIPDEELYARLGAAIAHEISHAFDAEGSKYDEDGNRNNWWTEEDRAAFLKKNEKLAAYFNAMHPWEGQDFDGENWKEEACADMGALKCLFRIAARKEDFDYDAFFRAFADIWLEKGTLQSAYMGINNVHPMSYLRINCTLQQFDEYLNFYGITEGDNMYLAPEDRVNIW